MSLSGDARVAAIDVGSNSMLLLVIAVGRDAAARVVDEAVVTTRLGGRLRAGGSLDPAAVGRTRDAVVALAARARRAGAGDVWAFATGAVRRAAEGRAFATDIG
ncbi:MAG: exopolyphosphatase, partial [Candidatus Binatia bacterium]